MEATHEAAKRKARLLHRAKNYQISANLSFPSVPAKRDYSSSEERRGKALQVFSPKETLLRLLREAHQESLVRRLLWPIRTEWLSLLSALR